MLSRIRGVGLLVAYLCRCAPAPSPSNSRKHIGICSITTTQKCFPMRVGRCTRAPSKQGQPRQANEFRPRLCDSASLLVYVKIFDGATRGNPRAFEGALRCNHRAGTKVLRRTLKKSAQSDADRPGVAQETDRQGFLCSASLPRVERERSERRCRVGGNLGLPRAAQKFRKSCFEEWQAGFTGVSKRVLAGRKFGRKMAKELCITIPCEPGKPGEHLNGPIYIYDGSNSMAAYKCPHCGQTGPRIKPLRNHMGLTMNIPAGCRVLKAQDEARRKERNTDGKADERRAMGRGGMSAESRQEERSDIHTSRTGSFFAGDDSVLDSQEHRNGTRTETKRSTRKSNQDASFAWPEESGLSDELWMLREQAKINKQQ